MIYPILPLTFTWETPYSFAARINQNRLNEGIDRRERFGINLVSEQIEVRVNTIYFDDVERFLRDRRGQPFRIRSENQIPGDDDNLYICTDWSWQKPGNGLWQLIAKLQQVRVI